MKGSLGGACARAITKEERKRKNEAAEVFSEIFSFKEGERSTVRE